MKGKPGNGIQFTLPLDQREAMEREIEAKVAARAKAEAWLWRFRLVTIETVMLASLIVIAGLCLGKAPFEIFRAAVLVGAGCFASGMLLLGLSIGGGHIWERLLARVGKGRS